jgi:hypothetical protein
MRSPFWETRRPGKLRSSDKLLRKFFWFGLGLVFLAPTWFYAWVAATLYLIPKAAAKMSDDMQAGIALLPPCIFMIIGGVLLALRFAIWLQEMAGLPRWWEDE